MPKDKQFTTATSSKIDSILGTHDWENALYYEDSQMTLFGTTNYDRVNFDELVKYVTGRLSSIFAYVSPKSRILKNSKNSPLFILYYLMTNKSPKAIGLGGKVVNQIFEKVDNMTKDVINEND